MRSVAQGQAADTPSRGRQSETLGSPEFHVWARPNPVFDYRLIGRLASDHRVVAPGCEAFLLEPDEGTDVEELIAEANRSGNARILWPEHMTQADLEAVCASVPRLEALWCYSAPHVRSVSNLGSLSCLREVRLPRCVDSAQLSAFLKNARGLKELRFGFYSTIELSEDVLRSLKEAGVEYLECPPSTTDAQLARLVSEMPKLRGISLVHCPNVKDPSALCALRYLEWVELRTVSGPQVIESFVGERGDSTLRGFRARKFLLEDLTPFAKLRNLEAIMLEGCDRVAAIEPLGALENLRHLYLSWGSDSAKVDFSALRKLKHLRTLGFVGVKGERLDVEGLPNLEAVTLCGDTEGFARPAGAEVPSVRSLKLSGAVGHFEARWLCQFPGLVALDLEALDGIPGSGLLDLGKLKSLRQLEVWMSPEDGRLEFLKEAGPLRDLTLDLCETTDVKPVERVANLEHLNLGVVGWPAESLDRLSGLRKLMGLSLVSIREITSVDFLADMQTLRRLKLRRCEALRNIGAIGELKELRVLEIYRCSALKNIGAIVGAEGLRFLRIAYCEVGGLESLSRLPKLRVLEIVGCRGVEKAVVEQLRRSLGRCRIEIRD